MADLHLWRDVKDGSSTINAIAGVELPRDLADELATLSGEELARLADDIRCDVDIAVGLSLATRARRMRQRGILAA